jgi:hypothetical protein
MSSHVFSSVPECGVRDGGRGRKRKRERETERETETESKSKLKFLGVSH